MSNVQLKLIRQSPRWTMSGVRSVGSRSATPGPGSYNIECGRSASRRSEARFKNAPEVKFGTGE